MNTNEKIQRHWIDNYSEDYDIYEIHKWVLSLFEYDKRNIPQWKKYLESLKKELKHPNTLIRKKEIQEEMTRFCTWIEDYESDKKLNQYLQESSPILEQYNQIRPMKRVIVFGQKTNQESDRNEKDIEERLQWIELYLEVVNQYARVELIQTQEYTDTCWNCNYDLSDTSIEEGGILICPKCGIQKLCGSKRLDKDYKNSSVKNGYEDRENFYKALLAYQGKIVSKNNLSHRSGKSMEMLFQTLDRYFENYSLPTGAQIRERPLNAKGSKDGTSREMMMKALSETGNSKLYSDLNWLCHTYWGYQLPDSSYLEETIMQHYDMTQEVYESMPKERKSSINIQYRLFKHLQLVGHPCRKEDFKMVETREILEFHDQIWKAMCEATGLNFIPTI